ncbi:hypothetical protein H9Y04_43865 [Streptomyces sp. TRM66268-LWL]|uniref:Uncharacterized protein n=1 Tax=Streptomyces polyasparticus TaxID=2767826 RepID=A0ABR7SVC7_9ACTN|nr:hypothetical protein [Streptomyces polyasparticus]MBC9719466.1 hypothetical protein [Streptomyces polyasparticus]
MLNDFLTDVEVSFMATYMDNPIFGANVRSNSMEPIPVLLLEPHRVMVSKDTTTGAMYEARTERLISGGFGRMVGPVWQLKTIEGWGIWRTETGLILRDPDGEIVAQGVIDVDPSWISAVADMGYVTVFHGAPLGVRIPEGRDIASYGTEERAAELRQARDNGHLSAGIVAWKGVGGGALKWSLLMPGAFDIPLPVAYMPIWNLTPHGGAQAFGFTYLEVADHIPVATGMVASLSERDIDLVRPGERDPHLTLLAGFRAVSAEEREFFSQWREAVLENGAVVVIAGVKDLPVGPGVGLPELLAGQKIVSESWAAVVPVSDEQLLPGGFHPLP